MSLTGEEFNKQFYCRFQESVKNNGPRYDKTKKTAEWTSYVKDEFLTNLGEQLGYKVDPEEVFGVDLFFSKQSEGSIDRKVISNQPTTVKQNVQTIDSCREIAIVI